MGIISQRGCYGKCPIQAFECGRTRRTDDRLGVGDEAAGHGPQPPAPPSDGRWLAMGRPGMTPGPPTPRSGPRPGAGVPGGGEHGCILGAGRPSWDMARGSPAPIVARLKLDEARRAFERCLRPVPEPLRPSLTDSQDKAMADHERLARNLPIRIFFAAPPQPMAAGHHREHQRPAPPVPPERDRPPLLLPTGTQRHRRQSPHPPCQGLGWPPFDEVFVRP